MDNFVAFVTVYFGIAVILMGRCNLNTQTSYILRQSYYICTEKWGWKIIKTTWREMSSKPNAGGYFVIFIIMSVY